ncbi:response regulator transcription factor [uncultured Tenacibaculum sp.]|uniref:response regulator transcription factor n=1 Tax=uncultured Tenacibaculum sp. TaxID=174713 RepID=UPI00262929DC|nr:response regulator transcription factor [uncultured Tenacibaculum sp.]
MRKINLILVDDHTLFLQGLKAALEEYDFINIVDTFTNPKKAFLCIKKEELDLVITDISMPEINGIEFIKSIKKTKPDIRVLAISMFAPLHNERNFYNGYLLKDTSISTVIKAIKEIVFNKGTFFYDELSEVENFTFSKTIVTKREREIIQLIAEELTVEEIAEKLFLSKHTVETHKKNIFFKLQIKTNAGLVKKAIKLGYIS